MTALLVVSGVYKTYEAEQAPVRALRGLSLEVKRGEFCSVMGPSGCGKSTLLNLHRRPRRPRRGQISIDGDRLSAQPEDVVAGLRRRHIGLVFQFFNLLDGMTALDNVAMPALLAGHRRRAAEQRARDLLGLLGLSSKADDLPGTLSGGQRQRLAIARALANDPTLLLADEPTGALDSEGGEEILELFRRLHEDGQTIVMVTHDAAVAAGADRIVYMSDGQIATGDAAPPMR